MAGPIPFRQAAFGGEIAPRLHGRTDWEGYARALKTCRNFIPTPDFSLTNRPGFVSIASTKTAGRKARLFPFVFSDGQAVVLEVGHTYVRFYTTDGQIEASPGVAYELTGTAITEEMLPYLKYAQSGDVIRFCYRGQATGVAAIPPYDLTRISNTSWTLTLAARAPGANTMNGAPFAGVKEWDNAVTYALGDIVRYTVAGVNTSWFSKQDANLANAPAPASAYWTQAADDSRPARKHSVVVTMIVQSATTGAKEESFPSTPLDWTCPLYSDRPMKWMWPLPPVALTGFHIVGFNVYRKENGLYGFVGCSLGTLDTDVPRGAYSAGTTYGDGDYVSYAGAVYKSRQAANTGHTPNASPTWWLLQPVASLVDDGRAPDLSIQPPRGDDPFVISDDNASTTTNDFPAVPAFFEQRAIFAGTKKRPSSVFGSARAQLANFDHPLFESESTAFEHKLAAVRLEDVRSVVPGDRLEIFTGSGEWSMSGAGDDALSGQSVRVRKSTKHGSTWLDPVQTSGELLFVTRKGSAIRERFFDLQRNGYVAHDVSVLGRHLLKGRTIVSWCFAEDPFRVVWIACDDGALLSLTYDREEKVLAWAQHDTGGDLVESLCCIPDGTEDAVFATVNRATDGAGSTTRYVERMATRTVDDVREAVFLDAAQTYDGRNDSAVTMTVAGGSTYAEGDQVTLDASAGTFTGMDGASHASFADSDVADTLLAGPSSTGAGSEIAIDPDGANIRIKITGYTSATQAIGELLAPLPDDYQDTATALWGKAVSRFTPLLDRHLRALADGEVATSYDAPRAGRQPDEGEDEIDPTILIPGEFNDDGLVRINEPACVVTLGLPYNCDVEQLPPHTDKFSIRSNKKTVRRVLVEVVDSRALKAGPDEDNLREWDQRTEDDGYSVLGLYTGTAEIDVGDGWDGDGAVLIRQEEPLPCCIVGITREIEIGGS